MQQCRDRCQWLRMYLLWLLFCGSDCGVIRNIPGLSSLNYSRPGDLVLGIIIPIHRRDPSKMCGSEVHSMANLQRVEAIAFAVEEINNRSDLLPNVNLGFIVMDDCTSLRSSFGRALHFIQYPDNVSGVGPLPWNTSVPPVSVVAVIGAEDSGRTKLLAGVFSIFKIPLLSYMSSSVLLNDRDTFSYFSRTIPSDLHQARVIADILFTFKWSYVSMLYTSDSYGTTGFIYVRRYLEEKQYCLARTEAIQISYTEQQFETIVTRLKKSKARVVVLLMKGIYAVKLFSAVSKMQLQDAFIWIASDAVYCFDKFTGFESVVHGMLSVNFLAAPVDRFEKHFKHMTLQTGSHNPWFKEYLSAAFNCSLDKSSSKACNPDREIGTATTYRPEHTVSLAIDAVYAWAYALHGILKNCSLNVVKQCVKPRELQESLRRVRFRGEVDNISFSSHGDGQTSYVITNTVWRNNRSLEQNTVAIWNSSTEKFLFFNKEKIQWKTNLLPKTKSKHGKAHGPYPRSVCSDPCPSGFETVVTGSHCCFICKQCQENERAVIDSNGHSVCQRCPNINFTWPDEDTKTKCLRIDPVYYTNVQHVDGIVLLAADSFAFVMTGIITALYIKNGKMLLIKASSIELSAIMLIGHVLTCALIAILLLPPTNATCITFVTGFQLSFGLTYGPLLIKTNCIYRIFMQKERDPCTPRFISPQSQVVIAIIITSMQVVITTVCVILFTPKATMTMPNPFKKEVNLECAIPTNSFLVPNIFNLILMIICAVYAFRIRLVPDNFNEARFITFSIYTTILLWLSFTPSYFISRQYRIQVLALAVALFLNLLSIQVFLFLPKLYAIYFLPEQTINAQVVIAVICPTIQSSLHVDTMHRTGTSSHTRSITPSGRNIDPSDNIHTTAICTVS